MYPVYQTVYDEEMSSLTRATVCFLRKGNTVLLGRKQKKIGKGFWNGYGGLEEKEDAAIEDTAVRETKEEIGVLIEKSALHKIGVIAYHNQSEDKKLSAIEVHFYTAHTWEGSPSGSDEMDSLTWFQVDALPFDEMMPSDKLWLEQALTHGECIYGTVRHDENKEVVEAVFDTVPVTKSV